MRAVFSDPWVLHHLDELYPLLGVGLQQLAWRRQVYSSYHYKDINLNTYESRCKSTTAERKRSKRERVRKNF